MNASIKSALGVVVALVALYILLFTGAVLTGDPMNSLFTSSAVIDGRDWMWVPVLFWAFIPTVMLLVMGGAAVWFSFKYRQKKPSFNELNASTTAQNAEIHTLAPLATRDHRQPERPSRIAS